MYIFGRLNLISICIIENGEHHYSAKDQTNSFSRYFEDLAVPKDNGYDLEFLDLCNIRHNIFDELCKQNSDEPQFSSQNICDAIKQLHSGKATDELGLAAEHFKNSPTTVTHFLTNCFNNIFINHHIPDIFKSGIVTPISTILLYVILTRFSLGNQLEIDKHNGLRQSEDLVRYLN
ncbi:unnamed protein product [Mytilus edulis]|uniref:Uncharacterized protein n=1 Tax=Mytilus edulis TaxID=6550 RepID=A0A8S3U3W7_MYTED|nr:unnamed protein product [Mytilus edulis]